MQEATRSKMIHRRLMYHFVRVAILLLAILLIWKLVWMASSLGNENHLVENDEKMGSHPNSNLVEVYYESMCPDSKYFIREQLVPTVKKVPELFTFKLIPYGKAETVVNSTGIYFTCQHKELECIGNKIHACAIKYIESPIKLLNFASCLIKNIRNPQEAAESCAKSTEVEWEPIDKCARDKEGSELLKVHGEATHSLNPPVSFIPTVVINHSQGSQKNILKDLLKEVCNLVEEKPPGCSS